MVGLGEFWCSKGAGIPDGNEVVISSSCELSTICAPFKATDLGGVRDELGSLVLSNSYVVVEDETGSGTTGECVLVPSHNTNAGIMTVHAAEFGSFLDIPDLNLSCSKSNTDIGSIT